MKSDTLAQLLARPTVTDDVIAKYIAQQDVETDDTDFKVTE
jgi:hypothetical protein